MQIKEIASGIGISKLDITVRNHEKVLTYSMFSNDINGAKEVLEVLNKYNCKDAAMEATGPYWYGIYDTLSDNGINVVLVNPASTKALMSNKTDKIDSNRLATLLMLNQLVPSYVPNKETRNLRRLTRLRAKLIEMRTMLKNITTVSTSSPEIMSVFSDMFGRGGMEVLRGIAEGKEATLRINKRNMKKLNRALPKSYEATVDPWIIKFLSGIWIRRLRSLMTQYQMKWVLYRPLSTTWKGSLR